MAVVSVVIPAYNSERFIGRTLESVSAQTLTDWELVVVNDGSTDGTLAVVEDYAARNARVKVVTQPNAGSAAARNRGFAETDPGSDYVIFLDNDDLWMPDSLELLKAALDDAPDAAAAHGLPRFIDDGGEPLVRQGLRDYIYSRHTVQGRWAAPNPPQADTSFATLVVGNCIITTGLVLIRRASLQQVGLFDAACFPADDWDMWLRLSRLAPLKFVDREVLSYRIHGNNYSHNMKRMAGAIKHVRRKTFGAPANTPEQRETARIGHQWDAWHGLRNKIGYARSHLSRGEFRSGGRQLRHAAGNLFSYMKGHP